MVRGARERGSEDEADVSGFTLGFINKGLTRDFDQPGR